MPHFLHCFNVVYLRANDWKCIGAVSCLFCHGSSRCRQILQVKRSNLREWICLVPNCPALFSNWSFLLGPACYSSCQSCLSPCILLYYFCSSFACILPGSWLLNDLSPGVFFPLDSEVGVTVPLLAPTADFMLLSIVTVSYELVFHQVPVLFACWNWFRFRLIVITIY